MSDKELLLIEDIKGDCEFEKLLEAKAQELEEQYRERF